MDILRSAFTGLAVVPRPFSKLCEPLLSLDLESKMTSLPIALILTLPIGLALASPAPGGLSLTEPHAVSAVADWGELAWSPSGDGLSAHGQGGLWLLSLDGGEPQPVLDPAGRPTFRHRWPGAPAVEPAVYARRDDIWLRGDDGDRRLTQGQDRFYDPVLSPDGGRVVFSGLVTGLHIMDLGSGELTHLGTGRWPTWHPDSDHLVFERNLDDGHVLTQADLLLWSPALSAPEVLTATPEHLDRFPTFSPDGSSLAWVRDGAVHVARVVGVAP